MRTMTPTATLVSRAERMKQFDLDQAAEIVRMMYNLDGTPSHIEIVADGAVIEVTMSFAIALAARLTDLALELANDPTTLKVAHRVATYEPPRDLVRPAHIDDQLREVDGL